MCSPNLGINHARNRLDKRDNGQISEFYRNAIEKLSDQLRKHNNQPALTKRTHDPFNVTASVSVA